MARKKEEVLQDIHSEALAEFDEIQSAVRDERLQCLEDRRFYSIAGAQWEGNLGDQFENKPKFEVNKIHLAVIRIINEYRNNRISVLFTPKDGSKNDKLADVSSGLYRADEKDSCAEEAKDNAFEEAVGGGMGAWRLRCKYENEDDEEDEKQRIVFEPIFDADSCVFFDLNAKRQDKSDGTRCYVLTGMSPAAYKAEYGDDPASWPKPIAKTEFDWLTPSVVYIAEHYRIEKVTELFRIFKGLDGQEVKHSEKEFEADEELEGTLYATGFKEVRRRKVSRNKVHKFIMNGNKIIEDCGYIAGCHIPIVVVYGKRWFVDGIERCMGHVRLAKDAQRLKNMQLSKLGEISAFSSYDKPIFTPEQMAGHAQMWADDNIKNYPYLLLNAITDQNGQPVQNGPIGMKTAPQIPPAMAALLQVTEQDMQDILGNQQAGEQLQNSVSGIAVELIQNKLDMQTFIYISNMAKAEKRSGQIWLSMAKDILVEEGRPMKTINQSGEVEGIELMRAVMDEKTGVAVLENDFSKANFDIDAEVGPTSGSKRSATVRALTGMMQITQDPETVSVLSAMAMMNMEGEGISDVRDFFRGKLIRIGAVKPTKEEQAEIANEKANAKQDSNEAFLLASAEEAAANAQQARANAVLKVATAEKTKVETAETISNMKNANQKHVLDVVGSLSQ